MSQPNSDKSESDVESDHKVAGSRAGKDSDGEYVGRASGDEDFVAEESGAEARTFDDD